MDGGMIGVDIRGFNIGQTDDRAFDFCDSSVAFTTEKTLIMHLCNIIW